jgi:hypothetical protein
MGHRRDGSRIGGSVRLNALRLSSVVRSKLIPFRLVLLQPVRVYGRSTAGRGMMVLQGLAWVDGRRGDVSGGLLEPSPDEFCLGSDVAAADVASLPPLIITIAS